MCYFIAVAVKREYQLSVSEFSVTTLRLTPSDSRTINHHIGPKWRAWFLTENAHPDCSCGLYVSPETEPLSPEEDLGRRRHKYLKKGWSSAKIERALRDSGANHTNDDEVTDPSGMSRLVKRLIAAAADKYDDARFVVHEYARDTASEKFTIRDGPVVAAKELLDFANPILPDTMYTVRRTRARAV